MVEFDKDKVGNIQQTGGIETAVLDNGPAKGSRVAWVNTGSGLCHKVAIVGQRLWTLWMKDKETVLVNRK